MGRALRWVRGLFGRKKSTNPNPNPNPKEKNNKKWGIFVKSFRERDHDDPKRVDDSSRRMDDGDEEEQNKRVIEVAAAHAAAAVVRITSDGGGGGKSAEILAAVKIQATFRAYLARRALRALKGLVKLQALVRGNIVRKQASETLRCLQALVRVQTRARACRTLRLDVLRRNLSSQSNPGPSTPEQCEQPIRARANSYKPDRSLTLKRNSSKQVCTNAGGLDQDQPQSSELRWLDQWMEERYCDTTKSSIILDDEKNAKVLEIDTGKPHNYNPVRKSDNNYIHSSYSDQPSHSFNTMPESPSKDSTTGYDFDESPQFFSASSSRPVSSRLGSFTPSKSECSRSLFGGYYAEFPNYMLYTESSRAKVRSQSAPKRRPEYEKSGSIRRGSGHGSSSHPFANKGYPGSGRLDRLGMPVKI